MHQALFVAAFLTLAMSFSSEERADRYVRNQIGDCPKGMPIATRVKNLEICKDMCDVTLGPYRAAEARLANVKAKAKATGDRRRPYATGCPSCEHVRRMRILFAKAKARGSRGLVLKAKAKAKHDRGQNSNATVLIRQHHRSNGTVCVRQHVKAKWVR